MNFQKSFTKKIAFILVVSLLSMNLTFLATPKRAEATLPVADVPGVVWRLAEKIVSSGAKALAKKLIEKISQATVDWINGGMKGNPSYIANINNFLTGPGGVADQVVGDFFANSDLGFLCDPFKIQVQLALQLGYGSGLRDRIGCTFTRITQNINNSQISGSINLSANGATLGGGTSKFANQGGWNSWLTQTLQPQNNPQGAYLIAKQEMDAGIVNAKGEKVLDLGFGQGALSFERCTDTYKDFNGNLAEPAKSSEYTKGNARPALPFTQEQIYQDGITASQSCAVKTPGSVITGMLTQKATTDVRQGELTATLANGIDAIFGALFNLLIQRGLNQLAKGVLDKDTETSNAYNLAIDNIYRGTVEEGNAEATNLMNLDWTTPNIYTTPTYTTTTPPWDPNYPTTTTPTVTTGGTGGFDPLSQAKNNANMLIDSITKAEFTYQNNYLTAQNLLTSAKNVFASSSICNLTANRFDSVLRSALIQANVVTNIDGTTNPDRTLASIPWNFKVIDTAVNGSNAHVVILNKATSDVNAAANITAVKDAMITVNSTSFNSDVQSTLVENIKTWIRGVGVMYSSNICPINLTEVLKINSATSTSAVQ